MLNVAGDLVMGVHLDGMDQRIVLCAIGLGFLKALALVSQPVSVLSLFICIYQSGDV